MTSRRTKPLFLILILLCLGLSACGSKEPVRHLTSDICLVVPNRSTRQEVLAYLGQPDRKSNGGSENEVWSYYYANKSWLRKTPYVGAKLGYEEYDLITVTFGGDLVKASEYRALTQEEFDQTGIKPREQ